MALNFIWLGFFLVAFIVALAKTIFWQDYEVFPAMMTLLFEMAKIGTTLSLGYIGGMTLWLGIMRVGEKSGSVSILARLLSLLFVRSSAGFLSADLAPSSASGNDQSLVAARFFARESQALGAGHHQR